MMTNKRILNLGLLFVLFTYCATSQTVKDNYNDEMCECIELYLETIEKQRYKDPLRACSRKINHKYISLLDKSITETDPNKRQIEKKKKSEELFHNSRYDLIYSCDAYFNYLEKNKLDKKNLLKDKMKSSDLENYNDRVKGNTAKAYYERAKFYFDSGLFDKAEQDILEAKEINPYKDNQDATSSILILLAEIYEAQGRYKEAILVYDSVYNGKLKGNIATDRALADKKAGGKKPVYPEKIRKKK